MTINNSTVFGQGDNPQDLNILETVGAGGSLSWRLPPNADQVFSGQGSPVSTADQLNGDIYFDTNSSAVWQFESGAWVEIPLSLPNATFGEINKTIYVDGVTYTTVQQALNALPVTGGTIVCPDGYTETLTSTLVLGNGTTDRVILQLGVNVTLTFNITNGSDCVVIHNGSGLRGSMIGEASGGHASMIALAATAIVGNVVVNGEPNSQAYFELQKVFIFANVGATVNTSAIKLSSLNNQVIFRDVYVAQVTNVGLFLTNGSSGSGPYKCQNIWVEGDNLAGSTGLKVDNTTHQFFTNIVFDNCVFNNPGTGQNICTLNGQASSGLALGPITFQNCYMEDLHNTIANAIVVTDIGALSVLGCEMQLSAANDATTSSAVNINQSAAHLTRSIVIQNLKLVASAATAVQNNIPSPAENIGSSTCFISSYIYGDDASLIRSFGPVVSNTPAAVFGRYYSSVNDLADVVIVPSNPTGRKPLVVRNFVDNLMNVDLDAGTTTAQTVSLRFTDRGTAEWAVSKNNANAFLVTDIVNTVNRLSFTKVAACSSTGVMRLGNTEVIGWRNQANSGDVTLGVNASDVLVSTNQIQAPTLSLTGLITKYNNTATAGNGVASEIFQVLAPTLTANYNSGTAKTLFTPSAAGMYRITYSQALVVVDGASSTFPSLTLSWTDVGGIARTKQLVATSSANSTSTESDGVVSIYTNGSTAVTATSASYASGTPGTMTYALAITAESL